MSLAMQTDAAAAGQAAAGEMVLADARALAGELAPRAAEFEAARTMPPDVVDQLREIGVFRMYAPKSHGGLELDFPVTLEILTALARIDGSLGWVAMIGAGSAPFLSRLPRATYDSH